MRTWIDDKLDVFFDQSGGRYLDIQIFKEIDVGLEEYSSTDPDFYEREVKRIRDLNNCMVYAAKERERKRTAKITGILTD